MKMRRKSDLPTKTCAARGRPVAWRRNGARDWEAVRCCSARRRRARRRAQPSATDKAGGAGGRGTG